MTGGFGWPGIQNIDDFVRKGGVLVTLGDASTLPFDGGITRDVRRATVRNLANPGSELRVPQIHPQTDELGPHRAAPEIEPLALPLPEQAGLQALKGEPLTMYGDGRQTRSFCYVSDLIEGILRLLMISDDQGSKSAGKPGTDDDIHLPTNIGNPGEFTVVQLARKVIELTGSRSTIEYRPLPVYDPRVRQPDISRAARRLGWEPKVSLEEGLRNTIAFFAKEM
jgi:dTDP-D-glucose 4,6-dehydratase